MFSVDSIINKWKKMKQQFKKEVDKSRRSGAGRRKKWPYLDEMEAICGHRDNITPTILLDSSKDDDPSDHSEGESNDLESSEVGENSVCFFDGNVELSTSFEIHLPLY